MQFSDETKKYIVNSLLDTIAGISNKEYQRRVWIRGEGPEVDDITETVCHFFEEGDAVLKKYKDFYISDTQYRILLDFRNKFETFLDRPSRTYYLPQEFIDTPEWTEVTEKAKEVLEAFNYRKIQNSKIKKEILSGLLATIADVSDAQFQQKAWVEGKMHPYCNFEETMHQLFDDYKIKSILRDYKDYEISDKQLDVLNKFSKILDNYSDNKMCLFTSVNPSEILNDPEWHEIQRLAKDVLKAFSYEKKKSSLDEFQDLPHLPIEDIPNKTWKFGEEPDNK